MNNDTKKITLEIMDDSGHTTFNIDVKEATTRIVEQIKKFGKWLYVNGQPHVFSREMTDAELTTLDGLLSENDTVTLGGALQGGALKAKGIVTKLPLALGVTKKFAPQIGINISTKNGEDHLTVSFSTFKGVDAKHRRYKNAIISALIQGLES